MKRFLIGIRSNILGYSLIDQAWTVVGKTNEDEDRATIANITGNGNDLVCLNLGLQKGVATMKKGNMLAIWLLMGWMMRFKALILNLERIGLLWGIGKL